MSIKRHAVRGFSLIEQILFIVIISVGVLGLLGVMNLSANSQGADPLLQKQALAIAESLLAEIQRQPFSYCDPDDDNARSGGLTLTDVSDAGNPPLVIMAGYQANIQLAWADSSFGLSSGSHAAVRIDITVSNGPANITLTGYRLRYAPQL